MTIVQQSPVSMASPATSEPKPRHANPPAAGFWAWQSKYSQSELTRAEQVISEWTAKGTQVSELAAVVERAEAYRAAVALIDPARPSWEVSDEVGKAHEAMCKAICDLKGLPWIDINIIAGKVVELLRNPAALASAATNL